MESIGQILKAARECKTMTVAELALAVKTKQLFIKAIESDQFDDLIAPVYVKGFIRLYAEHVGLDPQPLLRLYQDQLDHPDTRPKSAMSPALSNKKTVNGKKKRLNISTPPNIGKKDKRKKPIITRREALALVSGFLKWLKLHANRLTQVAVQHGSASLVSARALSRHPQARKMLTITTALALVCLLAILLRYNYLRRCDHYVPAEQTEWLSPPPEPYP